MKFFRFRELTSWVHYRKEILQKCAANSKSGGAISIHSTTSGITLGGSVTGSNSWWICSSCARTKRILIHNIFFFLRNNFGVLLLSYLFHTTYSFLKVTILNNENNSVNKTNYIRYHMEFIKTIFLLLLVTFLTMASSYILFNINTIINFITYKKYCKKDFEQVHLLGWILTKWNSSAV